MSMLCGYLGKDTQLKELRKLLKPSVYGVSLGELLTLSSQLDIDMSAIKFTAENIQNIPTPAVIHLIEGHFVILNKVTDNCVEIINPAMGTQVMELAKFVMLTTGYALILDENEKEQNNTIPSKDKKRKNIKSLISKKFLLLSFFSSIFVFVIPYLGLSGYDKILASDSISKSLIIGVFFAGLVSIISGFLLGKITINLTQNQEYREYSKLFDGLLSNTYDFFENRHPSDILNRMQSVVSSRVRLATYYNEFIIQIVLAIFSLSILLFISIKVTAVFLLFSAVVAIISYIERKKEEELHNIDLEKGEKLGRFLLDSVLVARDLKSMGSKNGIISKLKFVINDIQALDRKRFVISYGFSSAKDILISFESISVLLLLFFSIKSSELTLPYAFTFLFIKGISSGAISGILSLFVEASIFKVSEDRAKDFIEFEKDKDILPTEEFKNINLSEGSFKVGANAASSNKSSDYSIRYKNINISQGKNVLVLGPSGSGKTTLLKIVSGNADLDEGNLVQEQKELGRYDLQAYSYLHSNHQLFIDGTLLDNLTLFKPDVELSEVQFWLEYFDVANLVNRLPNGIYTNVSESINPFSSGEKQKLLLVRAFVSGKPILAIDEPTSNLNQSDSKVLMEKIVNTNRTIIASSHNESLDEYFSEVVRIG